jgi:hypothetical protein
MTLQEEFVRSKGLPVWVGLDPVIQMDRLPIIHARVTILFIDQHSDWGVAVKSAKGHIVLSDGTQTKLLHVWGDPDLASEAIHTVFCPDGELRVWNIYKRRHPGGIVTVDQWTGNSGMIVDELSARSRRYRTCCQLGPFVPNFRFLVDWQELPEP